MSESSWTVQIKWKRAVNGETYSEDITVPGSTTTKEVDQLVANWKNTNQDKIYITHKTVRTAKPS